MSLGPLRNIVNRVSVLNHIWMAVFFMTPERSTQIQHMLDATITMAFDEYAFPSDL